MPKLSLADVFEEVTQITSGIAVAAISWKQFYNEYPFGVEWFGWLILSHLIYRLSTTQYDKRKRRRFPYHIVIPVTLAVLLLGSQGLRVRQHNQWKERMASFESKLVNLKWIAYEPTHLVPDKDGPKGIKEAEVRKELAILRKGNFDGLITFTTDGDSQMIPKIAKELGFKGVIAGIIAIDGSQRSVIELKNAVAAQKYVDAYCIGHMWTNTEENEENVIRCLRDISRQTGKPVSTTLRPSWYRDHPDVVKAIDWFFPDVHTNWYTEANLQVTVADTIKYMDQMESYRKELHSDKRVLYKMICFPSGGVTGANPKEQLRFYKELQGRLQGNSACHSDCNISYFSAFDITWKDSPGWSEGEKNLGLYNLKFDAKPAALYVGAVQVPTAQE